MNCLGIKITALQHMHAAILQSARNSGIPDAVGLGSLCAVTAGRGIELQKGVDARYDWWCRHSMDIVRECDSPSKGSWR